MKNINEKLAFDAWDKITETGFGSHYMNCQTILSAITAATLQHSAQAEAHAQTIKDLEAKIKSHREVLESARHGLRGISITSTCAPTRKMAGIMADKIVAHLATPRPTPTPAHHE